MGKKRNRIVSLLLVLTMLVSIFCVDAFAAGTKTNGYTDTADGDTVKVVSQKSYTIVNGVTETDVVLNDQTGDAQVMGYMATISTDANVSLKATYDGYYRNYNASTGTSTWTPGNWSLSTTRKQVADFEAATGKSVVFATNGDYFNMQTGQPSGPMFLNGVNGNPGKVAAEPYFAVLKDGSYVIRDAGTDTSDVAEAVGSPFYLVKDGKNVASIFNESLVPVNSVGFKADGTLVFFMADGRQYPTSVGMTQSELADFLIAQGVVTALYLDGGGSATYMSKREGEGEIEVRNSPSDGSERSISSGLMLVANDEPDGVFDHAVVSPDGEFYTPGSAVTFELAGVDSASGAAELPESGLSMALVGDSAALGRLEMNGNHAVFTSNGSTGEVNVEAYYNGNSIGTAQITIVEPDEIYFNSASASLDFGEESTLGLVVRANSADVHYNDNDFTWAIMNSDGAEDASVGSMNGNTFVAGSGTGTINGTVSVAYTRTDGKTLNASIQVEIGKMPYIAFDYEPVNGVVQTAAHYHWGGGRAGAPTAFLEETNGGYYGNVSPITVTTKGTYTDSPVTATLEAPYNFTGNWDSAVPAADIFRANGYSYYLWPNASITTYNTGSLQTVSAEDGGQVRFGDYSLALNYDFRSYDSSKNSNWYMRYCGEPIYLDGAPNQVGVWVYADEKSYGFCLYADVMAWNGSDYSAKNFALYHVGTSGEKINWIDWTGWMYCYADTSSLAAYYSEEHPLALIPGYGMLWLSYQPGSGRAGKYAGTLYFDNLRFVYGTDLDDLDNPVISGITANGTALDEAGSATLTTNDVEIVANFSDYDGKNRSGIDATKTVVKVDGKTVVNDGDENSTLTRLNLGNGRHSVSVSVYDGFGNYSTETDYFYVNAEAETATATLTGADTVTMGTPYELTLATEGTVNAVDMEVIQVNSDFGEPTASFADGWEGEVVFQSTGFKKAKMQITAKWTGEGDAPADCAAAVLSFNVPTTMDPDVDFFTYQVSSVSCTLPDGSTVTAAQPYVKLNVSAYYTVNAEVAIAGYDTLLTVTDPEQNPVEGAEVYVNDQLIGKTDSNGCITTDAAKYLTSGQTFTVSAKKDSLVSFVTTITVMADSGAADGKPVGLAGSASKDGATQQTISWMASTSATEAKAVVEYSENADLSDAITVEGSSKIQAFGTSKDAARINAVEISGLQPGKTYYYRAGDGKDDHWSEITSFKTITPDQPTKFFVVGDTQMNGNPETDQTEIGLLEQIAAGVSGYDFGIQTGDYIDNGGNYSMWTEMQDVFGTSFSGIDVVHTMGNHEYYGDANGVAAAALYHLSGQDSLYYSVEYGNVYVAVINYNADLTEALAWLVEDAKQSDAAWKILSIHQPPYYTNVNGGSQRFNEAVPAAAEAAGIDAVFSGHDHSYARTQPMIGGQVDEDGVTYFICGDLGEKSRNINYAATNTEAFNFALISQEYSALYLDVTADEFTMTINARDADGSIIDSCTVEHENPCEEGHTWETYDRSTGMLTCSVCGKKMDAAETMYAGFANDSETGDLMYFVGGILRTGYQYISGECYYFHENGLAFNGNVEIVGETCVFENGKYVGCETADVLTAGLCGDDAQFILYANGTIRIIGSGKMYAYTGYGAVPWTTYAGKIEKVEIGSGITSIGNYSFRCANKISSITFEEPCSLQKIGNYAFTNLSRLTEIVLPETVTHLGYCAFYNCSSITSIYIPDALSFINNTAFSKTANVTLSVAQNSYAEDWAKNAGIPYVVRIPEPDDAIASGECGENAFWKLTADGTLVISGSGEVTTGTAATSAPWYAYRTQIKNVVVGKDITVLGAFAFWGSKNLESITFEDGSALTKIGKYLFSGCTSLKEVILPEGVTRIEYATFKNCTALTYVYLPDAIRFIDTVAFSGAVNVTVDVAAGSYAHNFAASHSIAYKVRCTGDHVWDEGVVTTPATCTTDGVKTYTCTMCGETYTETIEAPGHQYEMVLTDATCTTDGSRVYTCVACKDSYAETIPALGHDYQTVVVDATCTEPGYTLHSCSRCGDSYITDNVDALGHDWDDGVVTTEATDDADGVMTYTCNRCSETRTEVIPARGHQYDEGVVTVEATCTEDGVKTFTCATCSATYTESIPALGHMWDDGVIVTEPTALDKGVITFHCVRCDETFSEDIPALGGFVDVSPDNPYYEAVMWAADNGIVAGTSATEFSPNSSCTRAQFVTFLWRAAGRPEPTSTVNPFTDVKENSYYYKAILWAVENKIVYGVTETSFAPNTIVNKAQAVTFLYRYAGSPDVGNSTLPFADAPGKKSYCYTPIVWAVENGLVAGNTTYFTPYANCSRAQAVSLLFRYYDTIE